MKWNVIELFYSLSYQRMHSKIRILILGADSIVRTHGSKSNTAPVVNVENDCAPI
jgi:hypothetical protein